MIANASIVALLIAALSMGCGGVQSAPGADGSPCEAPEDCRSGLTCKAARCGSPQSPIGGVCVTRVGCEPDLQCVSGRCSSGLASARSCRSACAHLRTLLKRQHQGGHEVPERAGQGRDPLALVALADFEQQCYEQCTASASEERAKCLLEVRHLDEMQLCP